MNAITLTTGELENLLKCHTGIDESNRIALLKKGIETELTERQIGLTVPEMQERIRELEVELRTTQWAR